MMGENEKELNEKKMKPRILPRVQGLRLCAVLIWTIRHVSFASYRQLRPGWIWIREAKPWTRPLQYLFQCEIGVVGGVLAESDSGI